jgi:hypothetical protein
MGLYQNGSLRHLWLKIMTHYKSSKLSILPQQGAIVLVTVVLLLVMVTLVTLYTAKIQSFEHKIMLNSQNQKLAFTAAEAGIMRGLAELQQNKDWPAQAINEVLAGQEHFSVNAGKQTIVRHSREMKLFELSSVGISADGLARSTIKQQVMVYPLLTQIPRAALLVAGGLNKQTSFELVANPNGAGEGVALTVWTSGNIDMASITGFTCGLQEYQDGQCKTHSYSSSLRWYEDVLFNDPEFPSDVFAHLFNVSFQHNMAMRGDAEQVLSTCNVLSQQTSGVVWVDGECNINVGLAIGSPSHPLLLFVNDGSLRLGQGSRIHGLIVMLKQVSTVASYDVFIPASSAVYGAIVANYELGSLAGSLRVIYDKDSLSTLVNSAEFLRVATVPGSWHDL